MKGVAFLGLLVFLAIGALDGTEANVIFDTTLQKLIQIIEPHKETVRRWVNNGITDSSMRAEAEYINCDVCYPAAALIRPFIEKVEEEDFVNLIGKVCEILHLAPSDDICIPTIGSYAKPVLYIIKHQKNLTNDDFCGIINPDCATNVNPIYLNWTVAINQEKPVVAEPPQLDPSVVPVKILQFTDIHLDLDYVEGMNADCPYPVCCRENNGIPDSAEMAAGPYGNYKCALPGKALDAIYADAKQRHPDPKFIFLTGDYVHSGVWLYSAEENGRHIESVTERLNAVFPNTPVFPITGNHETHICNMYPPTELQVQEEFSLKWMYNATSFHFGKWMGQPAVDEFMHAGFYSVFRPEENLRIVVLNTNLCYIQNFWLPYQPIDPEKQLEWFSKTMLASEKAGENVYLIGHISPGSDSCWPVWSEQYNRIVKRFGHLIRGQFHGHSHREYFIITFDDDKKPITTSYVGPSAVTDSMNPGYKVYQVDGARGTESTWEVMDHETWILDLVKSNAQNSPEWFKEYSAKETFGLQSLRPADHYELVKRMAVNHTLFEAFHLIHRKSSTLYEPCTDATCISGVLCETMLANSADHSHCTEIEKLVQESFPDVDQETTTAENGSIQIISSVYALILSFVLLKVFNI